MEDDEPISFVTTVSFTPNIDRYSLPPNTEVTLTLDPTDLPQIPNNTIKVEPVTISAPTEEEMNAYNDGKKARENEMMPAISDGTRNGSSVSASELAKRRWKK